MKDTDVDPSGDGVGGLTATGLFCGSCGAQASPTAKFCVECGTRLTQATQPAEYKQVTVGAALEDNRIARNPCDSVRLPKRQHADRGYLTHVQVSALADAVDRQPEVVRLLAYTGLRWCEMAALRCATSTCCAAASTCRAQSPNLVGWCEVRRKPGSTGRFRSRPRLQTSWPC